MVMKNTVTIAEQITELKKLGLRNCQIARALGVSRQYVSRICRKKEYDEEPLLIAHDDRSFRDNKPFTTSAASRILGVLENTIRRWSNEGKIPCFRIDIGRKDRRFYYSDLERLKRRITARN
jgi:excisionase family DNA binding protein